MSPLKTFNQAVESLNNNKTVFINDEYVVLKKAPFGGFIGEQVETGATFPIYENDLEEDGTVFYIK